MSFSFGGTSVAQPTAPASSGFSFGSTAPTTSSGFSFGTATTPAPAATGGGFSFGSSTGTASPSTTAPVPSGFGFGGATTGATSTAARSLFGGASPATSGATAPASGFSFGAAAPGATGTTTAAPASGFGFGAATSAAPATGGSSFFGTSPAAPATGSSFFGAAAAPTTTGTSSFFGATPAAGSSAFGTNSALTTTGAAPSSSFGFFGGAAAAPQQNGQGITLETAFEALPADVKKNVVAFHQVLKAEDQSDAFLKTVSPRKLGELSANIERLGQDVLARRNVQDRQATAVHHARKDMKQLIRQVDAATLSMRSLDGNSAAGMYHIQRHVETPSPYYWELLDHYESKMQAIKAQIEDIESEYRPLYERRAQGSSGAQSSSSAAAGMTPALLHQILMQQNASLMHAAARVAEVHERAEEMRQLFLVTMRQDMARHGELDPAALKNPFEKRKKSANEDKRETIDKIRFRTSVAPTIVAAPVAPAQPAAAASSFGGFGAPAAATTATPSLFGSTTGTSAFGSTPAATAPGASSLFGSTAVAAPAAATRSSSGGFNFGSTTAAAAAPKQVSFNLGATTAAAPGAPAAGTAAAAPTTMSAFSVPSVATSGSAFGSSFLPGAAPGEAEKRAASSKRLGGRAKKRA